MANEYDDEKMDEYACLREDDEVLKAVDETELKPCPFCGSDDLHFSDSRGGDEGYITCWNCDARGPDSATEKRASSEWNNRPNEAPYAR